MRSHTALALLIVTCCTCAMLARAQPAFVGFGARPPLTQEQMLRQNNMRHLNTIMAEYWKKKNPVPPVRPQPPAPGPIIRPNIRPRPFPSRQSMPWDNMMGAAYLMNNMDFDMEF